MKYCENCGAELEIGARFCGECGAAIENETEAEKNGDKQQDPLKQQEVIVPETKQELVAITPSDTAQDASITKSPKKIKSGASRKNIIPVIVIGILLVLAGAFVVLWQFGIFGEPAEPVVTKPVQTVDQDNLYETLEWKEDQDQEYTLKSSLIEGNSDANIKEIFEESAYFTPKGYKFAMDGGQTYYQISCQYKKQDKKIPYTLIFQVNDQEHLELAELHNKENKVDSAKFDSFYKKLYKTKAQVEAANATTAAKSKEDYYFKENESHLFYNAEKDALMELTYYGGNCIYACIWDEQYDETTGESYSNFEFSDLYFISHTSGNENHIFANKSYYYEDGDIQLDLVVTTSDDKMDKDFPYMILVTDEILSYDSSYVSGTYYEFYPD